jgi:undecaprenyl-diphosphatase
MNVGSYLWLGLVALFFALLVVAFAYLTLRRSLGRSRRSPGGLFGALRRLDGWLRDAAPRMHRMLRRRLTLREWYGLALTLAAAMFFGLVWLFTNIAVGWTSRDDLYQFDQAVHAGLAGVLSDWAVQFFRLATHLGDGLTVALVAAGVAAFLLYHRDGWRAAALGVVVGLGQGVLVGLKWAFARARPGGNLVEAGFYSFPSGHAFSSMVLYGFIIVLVWRYVRREAVRVAATILLVLVIATVGLSRVALSVHWASDVMGGFTLGLAWLVCGLTATRAAQAYRAGRAGRC